MSEPDLQIGMNVVQVRGFRCHCGHEWVPKDIANRNDESYYPTVCPKCKSLKWDQPREIKGPSRVCKNCQRPYPLIGKGDGSEVCRSCYREKGGQVARSERKPRAAKKSVQKAPLNAEGQKIFNELIERRKRAGMKITQLILDEAYSVASMESKG